jgi:hypothetical protein
MKRRAAASVLRFTAGSTPVAIAAAAVTHVGSPDPGTRHIAAILGLARDPSRPPGRTITIRFQRREAMFSVDDPVEVDEIQGDELVAGAEDALRSAHSAVIGFARKRGELVLLLDLERLVDASLSG